MTRTVGFQNFGPALFLITAQAMSSDFPTDDSVSSRIFLCEERIGYRFQNHDLLRQALTHSSYATTRLDSNERLEFLGDTVLGMVMCRYLYEQFPEQREGRLTQQKSSLVSRSTCARVAKRLGLTEMILVGRGLQSIPESIDAALVESLIAAIYLDGGIDEAAEFILRSFSDELAYSSHGDPENYKSVLQEETQRTTKMAPSYLLVDQRGPDHAREYCVAVEIEGQSFETAWGRSKKEAEQRAAMNALQTIKPELLTPKPE